MMFRGERLHGGPGDSRPATPSPRGPAGGFTLVELLVTLAVALVLMAGLYQFFVGQQRTYTTQDEVLRLQQEARIAQDLIGKAIRQTGAHVPGLGGTVSLRGQVILAASDHYLTVQFDDPYRTGDLGVITAPEVVTYAVSKPSGTPTERVGDDPSVAKTSRTVTVYFDADGDGQVESTEQFALSIPLVLDGPPYTLYRIVPDETNPTGPPVFEAVAGRVDNLVFRYYDRNGNPIPRDAATGAALPPPYVLTAAERTQVRSVGIELVLRTRSEDPRYSASFVMLDNSVGTYDANGDPRTGVTLTDGYRRRTFRSQVSPRNLSANVCGRIELTADPAQPTCPASSTVTAVVLDRFGDPVAGAPVTFSVDPGSGASVSVSSATTNASGEASTVVSYVGLARAIAVSAAAVLDCSPVGPSSYTLTSALPISFMPGDPVRVEVGEPSETTIYTCTSPDEFTFAAHAYDTCDNEVAPLPGLLFQAVDSSGGSFGTVTGASSGTAEFTEAGETFTVRPPSGLLSAPRSGSGFPMNVQVATPMPSWLSSYSGLPFSPAVTLKPWPPSTIDSWTADLGTSTHQDCPSADVTSTFQVLDCGGNWIEDLTVESGYSVQASITPDAAGPTANPDDQGTLYSDPDVPATSAAASIEIFHGPSGTYELAYRPPTCTLGPPSSQTVYPRVDLSLETPGGTAASDSQSLTLTGCMDCEITATPTSMDSGTCSTSTESTTISVGSCTVPDGTSAELEVISTGGNATWALSGSTMVTTTTGTFSGGVLTAPLYKGNARSGDKLTIRVYVPSKAAYLAAPGPSGSVFMCEAVDLVTVDSKCDSIHVSNRSFTELGVSATQTLTQNYPDPPEFRSGDKIYIEVFDCDENVNSAVPDTIEVTVTSPQGYSPPAPDVETVTLTETGNDTGIFRNDSDPLPITYCGIPGGGDVSGNGILFVREGYPITIQYTDDDDPADNGCQLSADIAGFACSAFNYSYFAENYIHLDRHGVASNLTIGGSVWTNGEFELSSDMLADARGPDGVYGTGDDYTIVALGHLSNGGQILGDVYAPSYDSWGPDGEGQNTQDFGTHAGSITGNIYLRDGFRYDSASGTYSVEVVGDDPWETVPSYGSYASRAAPDVAQPPPGSSVTVHPITGSINGSVFTNYSSGAPLYDPNVDPTYALDPPDGEVLVAKDLPQFDYELAKTLAKDMTSNYHQWCQSEGVTDGIDSDTYFNDVSAFETFIKSTAGKTFVGSDGTSYTSTTSIYIIGDHVEGTVFYVDGGIDFSSMDLGGAQLIVNGTIVAGRPPTGAGGDLKINDGASTGAIGGVAVYGCGQRPVDWRAGWTGKVYEGYGSPSNPNADVNLWASDRGGWEDIPYTLPALIGQSKVEVKDRTSHTATFGIVYSENEIHYHNKLPEGKAFLIGAEIGNIIHNCLYMDFQYNECVKASAQDWFGCFCDTGGTPYTCTITVSPSAATVTQGGTNVGLTATASPGPATFQWSVSGTSGGSLSSTTGSSVTYLSGPAIGTDTVTVTDTTGTCLGASSTITVIGSCTTSVTPTTSTVPVTQSITLSASSTGGGPYTWSIVQNESGGSLNTTTGDTVVYTAGSTGGVDIIEVTDAGGCDPVQAVLTVDPCYIEVTAEEYDGASCTGTTTNNVDAGGTVCLTGVGGSGDLAWFSDDPDALFSFDAGATWEQGTAAVPTSGSTTSGVSLLYQAGTTLGTFTVTAQDPESCRGNQILTTCGMSFDAHAGSIYETQTLDVSVSNPAATPVAFGASAGSIASTGDTTARFTPGATGAVTLTAEDALGCTAATSVTVIGCPTISATASPADSPLAVGTTYTLTASGGTADYEWSLASGSGTLATTSATTASFLPDAEGTGELRITDANGCPGTYSFTAACPSLTVTQAPADDPLTVGTEYTLTVSGGSAPYSWSLVRGSGSLGTSGTSVAFTPDSAGTVEIRVTDAYGCTTTWTIEAACPGITITHDPADDPLTIGDTYTMTASGGSEPYAWTLVQGAGSLGATGTSVPFTPSASGTVEIRAEDANSCTGTFTGEASCPEPTVEITTPADGAEYGLATTNGASLVWEAVPDDNDGSADSLDNIDYVVFEAVDESGTVVHTQTESWYRYCGFGGNEPCNAGDVSSWADGTYTLRVTAYTEPTHPCGVVTATDSIQITVNNSVCTVAFSDDFEDESLDGGWTSQDIGSPSRSGSVSEEDGILTVEGGGSDIWGSSDQFHFVYRTGLTASDDFVLTVKVLSVENVNPWTKGALMVRDSLDADAKFVDVIATPGNKYHRLQWRSSTGGSAWSAGDPPGLSFPYYLRLVKSGNTYTAYLSDDPSSFGSPYASTTVSMSGSIYVGLGVTAHKSNGRAEVEFDDFTIECP